MRHMCIESMKSYSRLECNEPRKVTIKMNKRPRVPSATRRGLVIALCAVLLNSLGGITATSAIGISTAVKVPSRPTVKVIGSYWGISIYFTPPAGSATPTSYQFSVNNGKTWSTSYIPYAFFAGTRGTTYTVLARARNSAGNSLSATARATHKAAPVCAPGQSGCTRIPLPSSYIRVKKTLTITVGSSLKLATRTNVDPTYDASGACAVSETGIVQGITVGNCEIYVYGYGNFIQSQGFAKDNAVVFVRPKGTPTGSNSILANDFSCGLPSNPSGTRASKSFLKVIGSTKSTITLHIGEPTNAATAGVTCFDYSIDGARTWNYAIDTKASRTFTISGLKSLTSYRIVTRAIGKAGSGFPSNVVVVKTK